MSVVLNECMEKASEAYTYTTIHFHSVSLEPGLSNSKKCYVLGEKEKGQLIRMNLSLGNVLFKSFDFLACKASIVKHMSLK